MIHTPYFFILGLSCQPAFTADIAGYVLDIETEKGIEGATIRIFEKEPETALDTPYISETSTSSAIDSNGSFSKSIIWRDILPQFGEDGDYQRDVSHR